jgi:hypothetical protein
MSGVDARLEGTVRAEMTRLRCARAGTAAPSEAQGSFANGPHCEEVANDPIIWAGASSPGGIRGRAGGFARGVARVSQRGLSEVHGTSWPGLQRPAWHEPAVTEA